MVLSELPTETLLVAVTAVLGHAVGCGPLRNGRLRVQLLRTSRPSTTRAARCGPALPMGAHAASPAAPI